MLAEVICFIVVLYIALRLWYENYTKPWKNFEELPIPRYTLLGHIPSMIKMSESDFFQQAHLWLENSKRDSVLLWVGCRPVLLSRNPLLFEKVLSSNKHISKSANYWLFRDWTGESIFLADGESWRKRRKLLTPSFHFNILQDFVKIMEKHSLELVNALRKPAEIGKTFNAFKIMKMYTIGIISETAMGVQSNVVKQAIAEDTNNITAEDRKFFDMIIAADRLLVTMILRDKIPWYWYKPLFKLFQTGSQYYSDLQTVKSFAMNIIEKRIEELEKAEEAENINSISKLRNVAPGNHKNGTIFIDTMLELYKSGDINIKDILNETQTFMFAGYDTVATALSWSLYLLGRNKTQQDKAHEEAMRVKTLGLPITESMRELNYIECVIKEVLRIHPSAGSFSRLLKEDNYFGTEYYPKGTNIVLSINEVQRNGKFYEEPMVFKPERFFHVANGVNIKENSRYTFVPFSAGPRNCIGQKFAMMELKTTLFHLLSEYEVIATQKEEDLKETFGIIHGVENENGLEIKFRKR